ncbi:MAG TPA: 16S rRNA (adenine(1518)-N(6)/adenine(1519)-N(6))-dimethyltransferase RsmA [Candidatus Dormibacteraeota bacterium]|nr:16S rRNA (adenine(1518)-N(6)/adenine(1519)-N(6))-dimethyltransferase RsmA [Candidatus Dormibacteraeota bacterium]
MSAFSPQKSLGQHWLNDPTSLSAIVYIADIGPDELVLEIGPGPGGLTEKLLGRAREVLAVELDAKLALNLPKRFPTPKLRVFCQDILSFDFSQLPPDYKVVANIPYYLTAKLIRMLSESPNQPLKCVLLIQKEVALRATAEPGQMSLLSVTAQYFWQVSSGPIIKAQNFTPPPKVDSQVLILDRRPQALFADIDTKIFFRIVRAGFSQRRKTLLNSLSAGLSLSREVVQAQLHKANIKPNIRAQSLSLKDWHHLYIVFTN